MANVAFMKQILAQIEANPATWVQSVWRCSTGMCFAGWAVELSPDHRWKIPTLAPVGHSEADVVVDSDGISVGTASDVAAELLGVFGRDDRVMGCDDPDDEDGRWYLFSAGNSLDDLRRIVQAYDEAEQKGDN